MHSGGQNSWIAVLTLEEWQILSDRKKWVRKGQRRGLVFIEMGIFGSEHGQGKHHGLSGTGSIKGKAGKEQGSKGIQPCWAETATGMALISSFHLLALSELTRVVGAKFQSIKWTWVASVLHRNTDWLDKTAEFSWNCRGKGDKLKFGLEHWSQQQLYIMWLRDVMPWSTNKCIFTSHPENLTDFFLKMS